MKGILFTETNFIATVEERKTNTRRLVGSRTGFFNVESKSGIIKNIWQCDADGWNGENLIPVKPKYKIGEIVYLKEPYFPIDEEAVFYKYNDCEWLTAKEKVQVTNELEKLGAWKNKMFMPAKYARYFIEITDVKCERLQDISDEDCLKEGVQKQEWENSFDPCFYVIPNMSCPLFSTPQDAYAYLINSINGGGTWESNPYVWSYHYKLIKS